MINGEYTETDQIAIGEKIAKIFYLQKVKGRKTLYRTNWGHKSAIGLFEMVRVLGRNIREGIPIND